jgi:SAM-dependent methyltransferase
MKSLDRLLQRWRARKAAEFIQPGAAVLDIGCADGELFRFLPDCSEAVGVDPDPRAPVTPIPSLTVYRGHFPAALPRPMKFDVITMLAVVEHIPAESLHKLARDCASHLKPGGRLIVTVPAAAVDHLLAVLRWLGLVDGMSLEQHHGFPARSTPRIFELQGFDLVADRRFQLGFNNLFVFRLSAG